MKRNSVIGILVLLMMLVSTQIALCLEKDTHDAINRNIGQKDAKFKSYLVNSLGFKAGEEEVLTNGSTKYKVFEWLGYGGVKEDEPMYLRSFRHYHDPLKPWGSAGYAGTFQSSILWSQNTDQSWGKYSWKDARGYFYSALTATNDTDRQKYFAQTFRGIGQLMHLVQDASVPAHTRNDAHIVFNYENMVEEFRTNKTFGTLWDSFMNDTAKYGYDKSLLSRAPNSLAPLPIARLIDTEQYFSGKDPNITTSSTIGLAEYSNANFFSIGTIFSDKFTYPSHGSVEETPYEIQDPRDPKSTVTRTYYKKTKDGISDYRLATVGALKYYSTTYFSDFGEWYRNNEKPALDSNVYQDYASLLIPRAVGYSAGLLDYFFRGEIGVDNAVSWGTGMSLVATNKSDEAMEGGSFVVTYQYVEGTVTKYGKSTNTVPITGILATNAQTQKMEFFFNSLPNDLQNAKFWIVYQGKLGEEDGAVVASPFSSSEKMVAAVASLSDYTISVNRGGKTYQIDVSNDLGGYWIERVRFAEGNPDVVGVLAQEAFGDNDYVVFTYKFQSDNYQFVGEVGRTKSEYDQKHDPEKTYVTYQPFSSIRQTFYTYDVIMGDKHYSAGDVKTEKEIEAESKVTFLDDDKDTITKSADDFYLSNSGTYAKIIGSYSVLHRWTEELIQYKFAERWRTSAVTDWGGYAIVLDGNALRYEDTANSYDPCPYFNAVVTNGKYKKKSIDGIDIGVFDNDTLVSKAIFDYDGKVDELDYWYYISYYQGGTNNLIEIRWFPRGNSCGWLPYSFNHHYELYEVFPLLVEGTRALSGGGYGYSIFNYNWNSWGRTTYLNDTAMGDLKFEGSLLRSTGYSVGLRAWEGSVGSYDSSTSPICSTGGDYFLRNDNQELFIVSGGMAKAYRKFIDCNPGSYSGTQLLSAPYNAETSDATFKRIQ